MLFLFHTKMKYEFWNYVGGKNYSIMVAGVR